MTLVLSPIEIVKRREAEGRLGLLAKSEGWSRVRLGDHCKVVNGAPFPSRQFNRSGRGLPLIRIRDVGQDSSDTYFEGEYEDVHLVNAGDLLIGMDGDFRLARWAGNTALLNQRVCKVVIDSEILRERFVEFVLPGYLEAIWQETSSVTVKHLSSKSVQEIPVPVPSLEEQDEIVWILEEQFSRLDAAASALAAVRRKVDQLRRSLLHAAFLGRLTGESEDNAELPAGWHVSELGGVGKWGSGGTPKSGNPEYYGGTIPWAVIGDLTEGLVTTTAQTITSAGLTNSSAKLIRPGTVMLAMYGASIGRTGIAGVEMATNQAIAFCRPDEQVLLPDYLLKFLQSQKDDLMRAGQGGAQPNISQTIIKNWPIPLAPIAEQVEIIRILEEQASRHEAITAVIDEIERRAAALRRSLLHAAFTGELTKEWREKNDG